MCPPMFWDFQITDFRFLGRFGILIWNQYECVFWLFASFYLKQTSEGQTSVNYTLFFKRHFREIGSPVANFDPRIISFGRIPPNMALNEIYYVFREILFFFVDFFWQKWFLNIRFFVTFVRQIFRRDPSTYFFFIFSSKLWTETKKRKVKKIQAIFFEKYFFKDKKRVGGGGKIPRTDQG